MAEVILKAHKDIIPGISADYHRTLTARLSSYFKSVGAVELRMPEKEGDPAPHFVCHSGTNGLSAEDCETIDKLNKTGFPTDKSFG